MHPNENNLQRAERHVLLARKVVADQEARILRIGAIGKDSQDLQNALKTFRVTLAIFEAELTRIALM